MSCLVRDSIKSGDLLVWDQSPGNTESLWIKLVRLFTVSDFGHVSVALREGPTLLHIEATMPRIRKTEVPHNQRFYVIPMSNLIGDNPNMSFFDDKIGLKYSIPDALRAYLGLSVKRDNRWQCAELTYEFYLSQGFDLAPKRLTPSKLVASAMMWSDLKLTIPCN